jgi:HAD superfamily hydrolase (TIGR01490 family)
MRRFPLGVFAIVSLAIFDLDNTLLAGDSDYLWGQFLARQGVVDSQWYEEENRRYYAAYVAGTLDIYAFLAFSLQPLATTPPARLAALHAQYMQECITPLIRPPAQQLVAKHRQQGDTLLIITATNRFITAPIARAFGIEHLLATEAEMIDGRYTGKVSDVPCFKEGKVTRLQRWLLEHNANLNDSWFYSDSHNDLPLLNQVTHPVAVDPDAILRDTAQQKHWPILRLHHD